MADQWGTPLLHKPYEPPRSNDGVSAPGWMAFHPEQDGFDEIREIHVSPERPLILRAHNLHNDAEICFVTFRDQGDCTKSTATVVQICGKPLCLTCCNNVILLAIPGRYAPVIDGERDEYVYLEEQKISTEMGALAIQQLKCCCP